MRHYPTAPTHLTGNRVADVRHVSVGEYRTEAHVHDEYMFLLPRTGQLVVNIESNVSPLRVAPMSFVMVPPQCMHDTHGYKSEQEHFAVYIAKDFVTHCERKAGQRLARAKIAIQTVPQPLLQVIRLAADTRYRNNNELGLYRKELTDQMVAASCIEAGLASAALPAGGIDARRELVSDICSYLDATLDQPISLDRVANEFGTSRRTLTRTFRDVTGETIVDYQSRQRVRRAALLLQTRQVTVVAAAAAVGIDSPSYLAQLFRKYGEPLPRSFKKI
ncbi:AraC family transcriptional regulator [Paraburkholderia sp. C35]|uniref:helix-turn-helix transcriptional regulator n=1 Tax=Paraburkholderia sp. C35 TaxID=2126993 RepID=UPI000D6938E3|nr:AraC family transcriptional regulator [Paraburkholderia sp. C35]